MSNSAEKAGMQPENKKNAATWGCVFRRWLAKGYDHGYAAYMADQWERRSKK